jgi:hypothetical protein
MVKKTLILFIILNLINCRFIDIKNPNTEYLDDGFTRIFKDTLYIKKKFREVKNVKLPIDIDTSSLYIESYHIGSGVSKTKFYSEHRNKEVYRFYSNGAVNSFIKDNKRKEIISKKYNPKITGQRGVIYEDNNNWFLAFVSNSNEIGQLGVNIYNIIEITKDSLIITQAFIKEPSVYVYKRQKITNDTILNFKSNW